LAPLVFLSLVPFSASINCPDRPWGQVEFPCNGAVSAFSCFFLYAVIACCILASSSELSHDLACVMVVVCSVLFNLVAEGWPRTRCTYLTLPHRNSNSVGRM